MAISGPSSYVSTTQAFLTHWIEVNTALPPEAPLIIEGGTTLELFDTARTTLMTKRANVDDAAFAAETVREDLYDVKVWLLEHMNMFNEKVRSIASKTAYARRLPNVPNLGDGMENFTTPAKKVQQLWERMNSNPPPGVTAPIILKDGTTVQAYSTKRGTLPGLYDDVTGTGELVSLAIEHRNDAQDVIYEMMKLYRLAVPGRIADDSALMDSLPKLTPEGGRTPEPIEITGSYDVAEEEAVITGTESDDADLKEYELRVCAGPEYSTETDSVVASLPPGAPPVFRTTKFLGAPGNIVSARIYVILKSGGEAGSNTAVVTRPV